MSKEVTIEELRENLEQIIAEVEAGESVTIVARTAEADDFVAQRGKRFPFRDLHFEPIVPPITVDVVKLIREDRDDELRKHGFS
jgi:antitoxin (DNA-binding transcriptional repressor) of toxin-antitoxin stability system